MSEKPEVVWGKGSEPALVEIYWDQLAVCTKSVVIDGSDDDAVILFDGVSALRAVIITTVVDTFEGQRTKGVPRNETTVVVSFWDRGWKDAVIVERPDQETVERCCEIYFGLRRLDAGVAPKEWRQMFREASRDWSGE